MNCKQYNCVSLYGLYNFGMNSIMEWRRKNKLIPLPLYFLTASIFFGAFTGIQNHFSDHLNANVAITGAIFPGLTFGALMTGALYYSRRRFKKVTGTNDLASQYALIRKAVKSSVLPDDQHTLEILPAYIDQAIAANKRTRIWAVIEFGVMTCLSIYLVISTQSYFWMLGIIFFIALAIYCYLQPTRQIERLEVLAISLKGSEQMSSR